MKDDLPKGEKAPADTFTGTVYVQPLAPKNANNNFSVASVTFEPGARAFWHTHPAGQTILVTDGNGLYQEKGNAVRPLSKGDVVICGSGHRTLARSVGRKRNDAHRNNQLQG